MTATEIASALASEDLELPQGAKALLQVPENRETVSRLVNLTETELGQQNKAAIENASDVKNRLLTTGRWVSVDGQREMKQAELQVTLVRLAKVVRVAIIQKKDNQARADAQELKEGIEGAFASLRTNAPQGTATKLSNEIIQLSVLPPQQLTLLRDTKPSGSREWSVFNAALDLRNKRDLAQREAEEEAQRAAERARLQEAERKKQEATKLVREQEVKRFSATSYGQEIRSACVATVERNGTIQDPLPSQKAAQKELENRLCTCMVSKFAVDPDKVNADERAMFDMIGATQGKLRNATVATMWSTALLACSIGQ